MQSKNNKKFFSISFTPFFLLRKNGAGELPHNVYDYAAEEGAVASLEVLGEKFLRCANVNAQVKLIAGLFSKFIKEKTSIGVKYCDKFISRDIRACFENFSAGSLTLTSYSYNESRFGGAKAELIERDGSGVIYYPADFLRSPVAGEIYPSLLKNLTDNLIIKRKNSGAGYEKEVLVIGTAYPMYCDIWKYFSDNRVCVKYVEFCDINMRALKKKGFSPSDFFNMGVRAARINRIADGSSLEGRRVKVLHLFPKFSHYEIEDSFFSKNIRADYLSLDYAGGGALSERDKIRLETFIKM